MSEDTAPGVPKANVKTLAIRLEPELHAQLSVIAQLRGSTITDEFRRALEAHIEATKAAPELSAKAGAVLDEIEREMSAKRDAIASLFAAQPETAKPRAGRKASGTGEEAPDVS